MRDFWFTPKFNRFDWYGLAVLLVLSQFVPAWALAPGIILLPVISGWVEDA